MPAGHDSSAVALHAAMKRVANIAIHNTTLQWKLRDWLPVPQGLLFIGQRFRQDIPDWGQVVEIETEGPPPTTDTYRVDGPECRPQ